MAVEIKWILFLSGLMMTNQQHLDYDTLNTLKEVMEDDFALLIDTFLTDSKNRIITLQSLIHTADGDAIRRAAHGLKGSCSNLGAINLAALCGLLEHQALASKFENFTEDLRCIENEFAVIQKMLLDYLQ